MGSPSAKYLLFSLAILLVLSSQQALLPSAFARQLVPMPTNTAAAAIFGNCRIEIDIDQRVKELLEHLQEET
uniref:Uncharacterized protein n=1 Tax=Oryza punctata TaxID=4537 RepID=A0A0E0LUM1_ORYPU